MAARILQQALISLLCVFLISGICIAGKVLSGAITESQRLTYQDNEMFSSSTITTQKDVGPVVNPTTPGTTPIVNPPATTTSPATTAPASSGGSWCIASPTASQTALQVALDYACGYGGADCSAIQLNAVCYDPNTVRDHASYAFNSYYHKNPVPTSCVFGGTAQLTNTDPSHGSCRYASPTSTPMTTPTTTPTTPTPTTPTPTTPTPTTPTPPSTITPIIPYTPLGGNGVGHEPTDNDYATEPSSAETTSSNLLMLITMNCLMLFLAMASCI
ncbi:UNVERIFIED_CONTAM: Glucan endo-1,3-beta-glucosidase 12 [Sesamum radiatum]|uniref:Glucan endo-1,3-beta-glucosidase 12 n=1 Tax=Sesamum radiatum TaxID=300843 RepID=A0AAW2LRC2_SESRA